MTRLRTDQACLDAQVRVQVAQQLNAELAQPRDTIPCPPPTESLERASARSFYKNMRDEFDALWLAVEPRGVAAPLPEQTPTASDCAPSPAASAPDVDEAVLPRAAETSGRPTCACGQTIWNSAAMCADCSMQGGDISIDPPIDWKIAADRKEDPERVQCAWSSPSSEGESW